MLLIILEGFFMEKGVLVLGDGTAVEGNCFGSSGCVEGEVVFNTAMVGYQESLTDPSYKYQILMPTYPLVGNYGISDLAMESSRIQAEGFVVSELCDSPSSFMSSKTLDVFLKEYKIPAIHGVDTRFLTRKIRVHGVIEGILKCPYERKELPELKEKAKNLKSISEMDLVELVSTKKIIEHKPPKSKKTVVLLDCGVKLSQIKGLLERNITVIQVPAKTRLQKIMEYEPDGVVVSNGPGDPMKADYVIDTIKKLVGEELPLMGICLGNQLISLAFGARTFKLKFGHRGMNQPVKELATNRAYITSQNHGFAVDCDSLDGTGLEVTHLNLNDKTCEGVMHESLPVMAVQYHPEAHPGPWDNYYLFDRFIGKMK